MTLATKNGGLQSLFSRKAGNGRSYTYTGANRQKTITSGASTITYSYDDGDQRISQTAPEGTTLYLNDSSLGMKLEKFTGTSGSVQWNEYLFAGDEPIGVRFNRTSGPVVRYYVGDHLGSISVITDEAGAVAERLSYDAWGKRRFATGADDPTNSITSQTTRGFTNHEHISNIGLINMNARTYDPVIGRFTSPDSMVEDYFKSQILNRYSYVGNNPLSFTDPTGQCFLGCFWKSPIFKAVVVMAAILSFNEWALPAMFSSTSFSAIGFTTTQLIAVGAIEGAVSGAVLSGNLSGAWQGAVSGALFAGVGSLTSGWSAAGASTLEQAGNVAVHGVAGGVSSTIRGGKFQSGFLSAGLSEFAGPQINKFQMDFVGNAIARSIVGGAGSVLGGGKFENGATTGAFGYMFNHLVHEHTTTLGGLHSRVVVRNEFFKKPLAGISFFWDGKNGNPITSNLLNGFSVDPDAASRYGEGNGIVKSDIAEPVVITRQRFETTLMEDIFMSSFLESRVGERGIYNVCTQNCNQFSVNLYSRMKNELIEARQEMRPPNFYEME